MKTGFVRSVVGLLLLSLPLLSSAEWLSETQSIMGTEVKVRLWHPNKTDGLVAIQAVMTEMRRIDTTLSPYIPSSELAQANTHAAKAPFKISDELNFLVDKSLYFSRVSDGAFDITFASVGWFYDYRNKKQPNEAQQQALLPAINYHFLQLDKQQHTLKYAHENVRIDLGGIAKGYAVDNAIEILKAHGVKNAAVSAGGDSRLLGDKKGSPWLIGIKNPRMDVGKDRDKEVVLTMPLNDVAVSTSGDYERYFIDEKSGERIHHIINPKTGRSATGVMSVTILGPKSVDTDALSTTVFVMGVKNGMDMINTMPEYDCVIIDEMGKVHYSKGLETP